MQLENQVLQMQMDSLLSPEDAENAIIFTTVSNMPAIRNVINELTTRYSGYCGVFVGNDLDGYSFIIGSASKDCRLAATTLREKFSAKGGGSAAMVQGSVKAARRELENIW